MVECKELPAIPRDPSLPWLATALDGDAMSTHFTRTVLPTFAPSQPQRFTLRGCRIDHVRYRPGRNCAIAYRLEVLDTTTRERHDLRFHGRMYPPQGASTRHARATQQPLERPQFGPPLHLIAPLDMVLWAFPNERKLADLGSVLDDGRLALEVLPEVIAAGWGSHWRLDKFHRDIAHYVPEHGLTLRVQATIIDSLSGERRPVAFFGKSYHDEQGAFTQRTLAALQSQQQGLRTPVPLCYQPGLHLLWQEALPGVPLADLLHDEVAAPALMRQAGEMVAALHRATAPVEGRLTYAGLLSRIDKVVPVLAAQLGPDASLITNVAAVLRDSVPAADSSAVLLHGDLHAKNLLAGSRGLGLIDLDSCLMGPAVWDLGSFIGAQLAAGIADGTCGRACRQAEWLLEGYGERRWDARTRRALDWSVACALVIERAYRSVSRLKPGRMSLIPALLEAATRVARHGWRAVTPC